MHFIGDLMSVLNLTNTADRYSENTAVKRKRENEEDKPLKNHQRLKLDVSWLDVPLDVFGHVFSYLTKIDHISVEQVCHDWMSLSRYYWENRGKLKNCYLIFEEVLNKKTVNSKEKLNYCLTNLCKSALHYLTKKKITLEDHEYNDLERQRCEGYELSEEKECFIYEEQNKYIKLTNYISLQFPKTGSILQGIREAFLATTSGTLNHQIPIKNQQIFSEDSSSLYANGDFFLSNLINMCALNRFVALDSQDEQETKADLKSVVHRYFEHRFTSNTNDWELTSLFYFSIYKDKDIFESIIKDINKGNRKHLDYLAYHFKKTTEGMQVFLEQLSHSVRPEDTLYFLYLLSYNCEEELLMKGGVWIENEFLPQHFEEVSSFFDSFFKIIDLQTLSFKSLAETGELLLNLDQEEKAKKIYERIIQKLQENSSVPLSDFLSFQELLLICYFLCKSKDNTHLEKASLLYSNYLKGEESHLFFNEERLSQENKETSFSHILEMGLEYEKIRKKMPYNTVIRDSKARSHVVYFLTIVSEYKVKLPISAVEIIIENNYPDSYPGEAIYESTNEIMLEYFIEENIAVFSHKTLRNIISFYINGESELQYKKDEDREGFFKPNYDSYRACYQRLLDEQSPYVYDLNWTYFLHAFFTDEEQISIYMQLQQRHSEDSHLYEFFGLQLKRLQQL